MSVNRSLTHSSMACHRRCAQEYDYRYIQLLERAGEDREVLRVGDAWHRAHDVEFKGGDPWATIAKHAPGDLWNEKLRQMFAGYAWYWQEQPLDLVKSERTFRIEFGGNIYEGQIDGEAVKEDGRTGIVERKTTSEGVEAASTFWPRLRMAVQPGLYALAQDKRPSFILYDVARKPTIRPKAITKADIKRMTAELEKSGTCKYFGTDFEGLEAESALTAGRETIAFYGSRLRSDIGDQPEKYFARREISRTDQDYEMLMRELGGQAGLIEYAEEHGLLFRNPDACQTFGTCDFISLCENNIQTDPTSQVPVGFQRREHIHPELVREDEAQTA